MFKGHFLIVRRRRHVVFLFCLLITCIQTMLSTHLRCMRNIQRDSDDRVLLQHSLGMTVDVLKVRYFVFSAIASVVVHEH